MAFDKDVTAIDKKMAKLIKGVERETAIKYAALLVKTKALLAKQYAAYEKDGQLTLQEMLKHDRLKKMMKELDFLLKPHYKSLNTDIQAALGQTYKTGFGDVIAAISKESKRDIGNATATPETLTAMLKNPVAGLTLNERLERMRVKIIDLIQKQITQGLQKNESYGTMAKRLKGELEGDAVKAMRIVRTEGHRVQESAKHDAAEHATNNGVVMHKEWNTMEDGVVRRKPKSLADHKKLNGKKIPMDQLFDDGLSKGLAPGQLPAAASSINCRCFLTYSIERLEKQKEVELEKEPEPVKEVEKPVEGLTEIQKQLVAEQNKKNKRGLNATLESNFINAENKAKAAKLLKRYDDGEFDNQFSIIGFDENGDVAALHYEASKSNAFYRIEEGTPERVAELAIKSFDAAEPFNKLAEGAIVRVAKSGVPAYNHSTGIITMTHLQRHSEITTADGSGFLDTLIHEIGHREHAKVMGEPEWKKFKKTISKHYKAGGYKMKELGLDKAKRGWEFVVNAKNWAQGGTKDDFFFEMFAEGTSIYLTGTKEEKNIMRKTFPEMFDYLTSYYKKKGVEPNE